MKDMRYRGGSILLLVTFFFAVFFFVTPVLADFSAAVKPQQTISVKAGKARYTEIQFTNMSASDACLDVESRGFTGEVCVPANETLSITKIFDGEVTVTNKSTVATITIHGKWL